MALPPRPVAEVPWLPQEDPVRKISAAMFHPEGAPQAAPDFDPDQQAAPEAEARAIAVEAGRRQQVLDAEAA